MQSEICFRYDELASCYVQSEICFIVVQCMQSEICFTVVQSNEDLDLGCKKRRTNQHRKKNTQPTGGRGPTTCPSQCASVVPNSTPVCSEAFLH